MKAEHGTMAIFDSENAEVGRKIKSDDAIKNIIVLSQ
jgi:hypothetical protein